MAGDMLIFFFKMACMAWRALALRWAACAPWAAWWPMGTNGDPSLAHALLPAALLRALEARWHTLHTLCPAINSRWGRRLALPTHPYACGPAGGVPGALPAVPLEQGARMQRAQSPKTADNPTPLLPPPRLPFASWGENEVLTSDMLVGTLFSLGTRVRPAPRAFCWREKGGFGLGRRCIGLWVPAPPPSASRSQHRWTIPGPAPPSSLPPPPPCFPPLPPQARRIYFTLPEALHRSQPGARQACFRHFRRSQVWDLAQPVEHLR